MANETRNLILRRLLALVLALVIIYKIIFPSSKTKFNSVDEFVSEGGYVYYDVPECAENLRYYYRETPFYGFRSIISFEINDSEEYDIYIVTSYLWDQEHDISASKLKY